MIMLDPLPTDREALLRHTRACERLLRRLGRPHPKGRPSHDMLAEIVTALELRRARLRVALMAQRLN